MTAQTGSALVRTLLCLMLLIEDLLGKGYDFVLTSRFQSDPLEKQFGQYQQMSGETSSRLLSYTGIVSCSAEHLPLSDDIREGAVHIAG